MCESLQSSLLSMTTELWTVHSNTRNRQLNCGLLNTCSEQVFRSPQFRSVGQEIATFQIVWMFMSPAVWMNIYYILLFLLLSLCKSVISDLLNQHLAVEGNEKHVANFYFSIANISSESHYFQQVEHCFSKPLAGMRSCIQSLHSKSFQNSRIWMPSPGEYNPKDRTMDCVYKITPRHWKLRNIDANMVVSNYHFIITQSNCRSGWLTLGGSQFVITAHNNDRILACRYKDTLNNQYHVSCTINYRINEEYEHASCLNLTVLLEYEHFDAFSESLTGEASLYLNSQYNSLRQVLTDNVQFCFEKSHRVVDESKSAVSTTNGEILLISGEWISQKLCDKLNYKCFLYLNESHIQAVNHHRIDGTMTYFAKGQLTNDSNFPQFTRDNSSLEFSESFKFHPVLSKISTVSSAPPNDVITFSPFDKSRSIHWVGSSHIRFSFDSATELYNLGYLPGGYTKVENMKSYHAIEDYSSIFSDDQADGLKKLCSTFRLIPKVNHTIIFMTGAWDLTFTPIRRLLRDSVTANKLASVIKEILDGSISCPHLNHFIWLTEIPYSPCYDDNDRLCKVVKGYRTNGAIAALNEYYINALSNVTVHEGLQFTVIDAYSIISPRLQLLPDVEYDCSFHYHCKNYNRQHDPTYPLQLSHTPGGDAMVRAILLALSAQDP